MMTEGAGAAAPLQISVLIPSRGRPEGLARTIGVMRAKESGANTVRYVVGCDLDDPETIKASMGLWQEGFPALPVVAPRGPSLGALANRLAAKHPADVYVSMGDDIVVLTDGWDAAIAEAWRAQPDGIWWWCAKNGATCAIVSEKWHAAAGRLYTDYFPFWYDDMWLIELQRYATGRVGDRIDIWVADGGPGTHRMRDLAFWDDFFWSRRDERKADAARIAARLGWPAPKIDGLDLDKNPVFDAAALEAKQGDRLPPTPEYLAAYTRAKALMDHHQEEAA